MALNIETFSTVSGGQSLFKALGHPLTADLAGRLIATLAAAGPVALYDPLGIGKVAAQLHDLGRLDVRDYFVQDLDHLNLEVLGCAARPVTELPASGAAHLFVLAFDAGRMIDHVAHLVPEGMKVVSLDDVRLPDDMLTNTANYLDPLNFATNIAFIREADGRHTRLVSANYWAGHGAKDTRIWFRQFDMGGRVLAEWTDPAPAAGGTIVIDSQDIRERFDLGEFMGSLFIHVQHTAGHDVVKYAMDLYGDDPTDLSGTHDANAWPPAFFAGLPAPRAGERVVLWLQNAHPCAIPAGGVGLNPMGRDDQVRWLDREVPPFGSCFLDTRDLFPDTVWPDQFEVRAGKHVVRPRYEIHVEGGRTRMGHANVERDNIAIDPRIPELGDLIGKGYILPAPILPLDEYDTVVLPTPMARCQESLPVALLVMDADGTEVARRFLGNLPRHNIQDIAIKDVLAEAGAELPSGKGHVELIYDFAEGGGADGWLHGLFHYTHRPTGHQAETIFGAHMFNTVLVYKGEPQSYIARPPGLSSRLFLRLGPGDLDTFCQLIYPASRPWHKTSTTRLILTAGDGRPVAERTVQIPCGGSLLWRYHDMFAPDERGEAGENGYVLIRDVTCRLFGYHGLVREGQAFSLDHMFGF